MSNRTKLNLIVAGLVAASAFVGYRVISVKGARTYAAATTFAEGAQLAELTTNGVRVAVSMESDPRGQPLLRATFTPNERGFHVYSKDLDPTATGGIGIATRLELLSHPSVRSAGKLFADVSPRIHQIKSLGISVDVYPDGPVTLRLPVEFIGAVSNVAAQVAVSYMACKTDGVCLPPVQRQTLDIQIASK